MLAALKRKTREHVRGQPGHRFQAKYKRARKSRSNGITGARLLNLALALIALAAGAFFAVFPGPAIPFFLIGGGLLAAESLTVARLMDWIEVKLRAGWRWGRTRWRRLPLVGRAALTCLGACCSALSAYVAWHLLHR